MSWSQTLVVSWAQFVVAAGLLLVTARVALRWIVQPADRIRLIQCMWAASVAVPFVLVCAPLPAWRLGLISTSGRSEVANAEPKYLGPEAVSTVVAPLPMEIEMGNPPELLLGEPNDSPDGHSASPAVSLAPAPEQSAASRLRWPDGWLVAATLIGLAHGIAWMFFLVEWIIGRRRLARLVRSAEDASPSAVAMWQAIGCEPGRRVRLLVSTEITTPLTFGWLRPFVVIPQSVADGHSQSLRWCLAHERSHIVRADILAWHGAWCCQLVLWYQPLFWSLRRELRICQDILADHDASGGREFAVEYSELLVTFARQRAAAPLTGALTFLDHPSQLMRRVTMLLKRPIALRSRCTRTFALAVGLAAMLACGLCTAVRIDTARAVDDEPAQNDQPSLQNAEKPEKPAAADQARTDPTTAAIPAYEQPAQLTYHCLVADKDTGRGVPNATVSVERSDSSAGPWPFKQIAKTTHVTDSDGKYTVEIPPEQSGIRSLYIQIYAEHEDHVRYSGGYSLSMIRKNETVGERPFFERLELQPASTIKGKVVSPAGEPLAGVKLFGFTTRKAGELNNHGWLSGHSQIDGSFRLNMMKGGVAFFWVLPSDHSIVQKFVDDEPFDVGEIRVPEGIRLSGRALSAEGKPVVGIAVNAYYQGKENEPLAPYSVLSGIRRGAITDEDGRFKLDPLPPGEYRVVPEDESGDPRHDRSLHPLPGVFLGQTTTLKDGIQPAELELQALPHINFRAQYLDSQGKKRSGSEFFIHGRLDAQFWSARARPNQEGTITLRLPHGLQDVQLSLVTNEHSALRHRKGPGQPIENQNYSVSLGTLNDDVEGFEIIRYKAPLVVVKAVDEAGQSIAEFQVVGHYAWMKKLTNYVATTTGSHVSLERQEDGRQRTEQLLPDEEVTFTVSANGYEPATRTLQLPEGETKDLVLTLKMASADKPAEVAPKPDELKDKPAPKETPTASGAPPERLTYGCIVLDRATGKGVPSAMVVVRRSNLTPRDNKVVEESRHTTDAEGKYSFEIPPEQVAMRYLYIELDVDHESYAARKGFGYALSMIRKNETLGERPFFERVELDAADAVTGKLLSPDEQPVAGVKVLGYSKRSASDFREYGSFTDTVSKPDGTFRLNLVKGGVGGYWILPKDFAIVEKYVGSQRGEQGEIRLQPGIRLSGRVLNVEGNPLVGVAVNIDSRDGGGFGGLPVASSVRRGAISDSEGRFAFDPLPAGDYRIIPEEHRNNPLARDRTLYPVPGVFLPKRVTLKEGVPASCEVQAVPHVVFSAQYLDSKGAKTSGHEIHVVGRIDQDYWFAQGRPDPQGTIALRIPHGLQDVRVQLMTNEHGSLRFRRGPDKSLENREIDIEFGTLNDDVNGFEIIRYRAPTVLVKPVNEAGQPVPGAKVTAAYPWGKQRYVLEGEARSDVTFEKQNDGRFRSEQVLPDEELTFTAAAAGYKTATEKLKLSEGETKELVLTLKKAAEAKQE